MRIIIYPGNVIFYQSVTTIDRRSVSQLYNSNYYWHEKDDFTRIDLYRSDFLR